MEFSEGSVEFSEIFVRVQENLHFRKFYQAGYNGLNRKS